MTKPEAYGGGIPRRSKIPNYETDEEFNAHLNGYDSARAVYATSGQTKSKSLLEAVVNVIIGYVLAVVTQLVVFPLFGLEVALAENLGIAAVFSVVSIARSYVIRRFFNRG